MWKLSNNYLPMCITTLFKSNEIVIPGHENNFILSTISTEIKRSITFIRDSGGKLSTRLYDKCDDFDFHIVNFPFLSSNIPSGPSYGVYISQLTRYSRCCSQYDDFRYRHKCLVDQLLSQGYIALRLKTSFKNF